ncbi:MAG: aldehyde dehydrogenase family protein [Halobacteriovoraceae bacterium]|jgi:acyl-CoA reductase-like NAD-dependent aldehyde dehydrogenase|nr:aldehyde dehydrogenase family protein [Halobacteriovoraceae bacterium]
MPKHQVINPATQTLLYEYEYTNHSQCLASIEELSTAGTKAQNELFPKKRYEILSSLYALVLKNKEKLAFSITRETGKLIIESRVEVDRALITIQVAAEEAKRITGESYLAESFSGPIQNLAITVRKPLGLIFCITPFNFPLNLALHKICPAFISGNTILYKPSECNHQTAQLLVQLCLEAGFPANVIKLISPTIETLNQIVSHKKIACVSFTGGTKTADKIAALMGRKKLLLELGGNDALVVFPDADLNQAVVQTIAGRFGTGGQKCTAAKRIFIHDDVYDQFKEKLLLSSKPFHDAIKQDPECETSVLGPLISTASALKVKELVDDAIDKGAVCLLGNKLNDAYFSATILENVDANCELFVEETFGPVIPLTRFNSTEKLIEQINQTPYGLQAGVFTNNLALTKKFFSEIEVGTVIMNSGPGYRQENLCFGGVKDSGMGREGISYAVNEMTYCKQLIF